jgi:hypothetical protein
MLFERRRPKKASVSTTIFATHMVTRHKERNEDPASPSYINHAARRRDHLYRREDAPLAPRRQRCLSAAEAAGSLFFLFFFLSTPSYRPYRLATIPVTLQVVFGKVSDVTLFLCGLGEGAFLSIAPQRYKPTSPLLRGTSVFTSFLGFFTQRQI